MSLPDSVDIEIIKLLGDDAQQNSEALAKKLNLSAATVRRRLRKLIGSGVLRIGGLVDPIKVGLPVSAVIGLDVSLDKMELALGWLANRREVKWAGTTTGRFDIIVFARFTSTEDLSEFVQKELSRLDGLKNSEIFICLHVEQAHYIPVSWIL